MKKIFNLVAFSVICLCALHNVFGQTDEQFTELRDKAQKLRQESSYRTRTETEVFADKDTVPKTKISSTNESVPPNRWHSSATTVSGGATKTSEFIRIGDKSFIKIGDGEWKVYQPESSREVLGVGFSKGGKFIETAKFNGQSALVYEEKSGSSMDGVDLDSTTRYWFSPTGSLLKTEITETNRKTKEVSRSVTIYEYDANIKIEAPIK